MAEITWSVNLVPYSEFKFRGTPEELAELDPFQLAKQYAVFCNLAMQGFEAGKKVDVSPPSETVVDTTLATKNLSETPMAAPKEMDEEEVRRILESGVGPTTELGTTVQVAGLEFTKVGESPFPEHNTPKPWEKKIPTPKKAWEEDSKTDDDLF